MYNIKLIMIIGLLIWFGINAFFTGIVFNEDEPFHIILLVLFFGIFIAIIRFIITTSNRYKKKIKKKVKINLVL